MKPTQIIYCDSPHEYNDRRETRKDNPEKATRFGIGAGSGYERDYGKGDMSLEDINNLGPLIKDICAESAYLLYWITGGHLFDPASTFPAWGFTFKTIAKCWLKCYHVSMEKEYCGPGKYTFSNVELLLIGRRGPKCWHSTEKGVWKPQQPFCETFELNQDNAEFISEEEYLSDPVRRTPHPRIIVSKDGKKPRSVIHHSRKPEIFQDEIERWLLPHTDTIPVELFATRPREGWRCLGAGVTKRDIRDDLTDLALEVKMTEMVRQFA